MTYYEYRAKKLEDPEFAKEYWANVKQWEYCEERYKTDECHHAYGNPSKPCNSEAHSWCKPDHPLDSYCAYERFHGPCFCGSCYWSCDRCGGTFYTDGGLRWFNADQFVPPIIPAEWDSHYVGDSNEIGPDGISLCHCCTITAKKEELIKYGP